MAVQSVHNVNLLGHQLPVWGFPSMAQHIDIAVCAHVSCWAILRYYSQTFPQHREYLVHDITKLVCPVRSWRVGTLTRLRRGRSRTRVFQAAGCFPLIVGKSSSSSDDAFYSQLLAYVESGFPLFVGMDNEEHAIVVVGYRWRQSTSAAHWLRHRTSGRKWIRCWLSTTTCFPTATVQLSSSGTQRRTAVQLTQLTLSTPSSWHCRTKSTIPPTR